MASTRTQNSELSEVVLSPIKVMIIVSGGTLLQR
jgi:hypothetical protein